jgi:hypothetical protein
MAGTGLLCADCGGEMERTAVERQQAGSREVTVQWACCPSCHHMALVAWSWTEPDLEAEQDMRGKDDAVSQSHLPE